MQTSSCSGSIDSEATALAVMPAGPSAVRVVITATPVVNREMAWRKRGPTSDGSAGAGRSFGPSIITSRRARR